MKRGESTCLNTPTGKWIPEALIRRKQRPIIFISKQTKIIVLFLSDVTALVSMLRCRCLQSAENADPQFNLEYRGPVSMKGKKEPMKVWFLSRKPTDLAAHS